MMLWSKFLESSDGKTWLLWHFDKRRCCFQVALRATCKGKLRSIFACSEVFVWLKISSLFGIFLRIFESKLFPQFFKIVLTLNRLMQVLIFWRYQCSLAVKKFLTLGTCVAYEIPSLLALLATKKLHNAPVDSDPGILSRQDRHYLNLDSLFSSRFLNFPELFLIFWE